ncbi:unnamed protein product [Protopolystoma xenopodis]|uniref:Uncharacterized protein n=1 Tax=Protopolystoma xenopodis TaxID=117903 RepID=A0A3S5FD07_9PLAT|nr:unnamed protein product [Protopolystoma xenopodis]
MKIQLGSVDRLLTSKPVSLAAVQRPLLPQSDPKALFCNSASSSTNSVIATCVHQPETVPQTPFSQCYEVQSFPARSGPQGSQTHVNHSHYQAYGTLLHIQNQGNYLDHPCQSSLIQLKYPLTSRHQAKQLYYNQYHQKLNANQCQTPQQQQQYQIHPALQRLPQIERSYFDQDFAHQQHLLLQNLVFHSANIPSSFDLSSLGPGVDGKPGQTKDLWYLIAGSLATSSPHRRFCPTSPLTACYKRWWSAFLRPQRRGPGSPLKQPTSQSSQMCFEGSGIWQTPGHELRSFSACSSMTNSTWHLMGPSFGWPVATEKSLNPAGEPALDSLQVSADGRGSTQETGLNMDGFILQYKFYTIDICLLKADL